jgi:hypothetical protein
VVVQDLVDAGQAGRAIVAGMRGVDLRAPVRSPAAALPIIALLGAACSGPGDISQEDRMDAATELASRPTSEQIVSRYKDMQQRIRDALDGRLGPLRLVPGPGPSREHLRVRLPHRSGRTRHRPRTLGIQGRHPDGAWPRAQTIITSITAEYGFATAGAQIDTPGRHTLNGTDTVLCAEYTFGTDVHTSMQVTTGCHLPAQPTDR